MSGGYRIGFLTRNSGKKVCQSLPQYSTPQHGLFLTGTVISLHILENVRCKFTYTTFACVKAILYSLLCYLNYFRREGEEMCNYTAT